MTDKTPQFLLRYRPWIIVIFQACLICCSLLSAWLLRFDFTIPYRSTFLLGAPLLLVIRLSTLAYFGLMRGWWKYVGVHDAIDIVKAVISGTAIFWVIMRYALRFHGFPRTIYVLEALLTAGLLIGVRLLSRVLAESVRENISSNKRILIIGAGAGAQTILREIRRSDSGFVALGCLDDDRSKHGIRVNNVPILGSVDQLEKIVTWCPADEVLIAVPSATGRQMQKFVQICTQANIPFRTLPALRDIIKGEVIVRQLREVSLEDLLGREPVQIDLQSVCDEIGGRVVLVTGAAGSIGSELCRQILDYGPAQLVCLDQSETGLFFLQLEIQGRAEATQLKFCVADIADHEGLSRLLAKVQPEIIFHAAAYKHVPMMEENVQEAVKNNVLALNVFLDQAEEAGCASFVLISSDKAVNPTNIMGATKRIGELIVASRPGGAMRCVSVRFGNVLGSNGSVIPVLKQQLQNHQPLTITHPEIKRFFMTTREAVALVLQAFTIGAHADILVLDMGQPIRILDLARSLIRLSGKCEEDVPIIFTGLRNGEKLEEELFYEHERVFATSCEKIKRTNGASRNWLELQHQLHELRLSMSIDGATPVRAQVKKILPEYSATDLTTQINDYHFQIEKNLDRAVGQD